MKTSCEDEKQLPQAIRHNLIPFASFDASDLIRSLCLEIKTYFLLY